MTTSPLRALRGHPLRGRPQRRQPTTGGQKPAQRLRGHLLVSVALFATGALLSACSSQQTAPQKALDTQQEEQVSHPSSPSTAEGHGPFELKPEPEVACERTDQVDVNLGHSPEAFVRNAHCQVTGKPASDAWVAEWAEKLRTDKLTRRIDVIHFLCQQEDRKCELAYSDPWKEQVELSGAPERKVKREVGAVCMFFFNCPGGVNCGMDWANTHALGMKDPHPMLGFGDQGEGYYVASNAGFWRRELLDAQWAGLSFLMPNVYGPDIEEGKLAPLQQALDSIDSPPKIAMFDDSWTWGEPWFSDFWKQKPDLRNTEEAAKTIYNAKWKPFFSQIDKKYWYRFKGQPFIYVYNAGKLVPRTLASKVFARMKEMFQADFGEEPFLSVDSAFFDDKKMKDVAQAKFKWFTFQASSKKSRSDMNGVIIDHAMVRWDAVGREHPGKMAKRGDFLVKDGKVLQKVLDSSKDADLLIIATWNDLGEGTGINRNYDYYAHGEWLAPHHFMRMIRNSQSGK